MRFHDAGRVERSLCGTCRPFSSRGWHLCGTLRDCTERSITETVPEPAVLPFGGNCVDCSRPALGHLVISPSWLWTTYERGNNWGRVLRSLALDSLVISGCFNHFCGHRKIPLRLLANSHTVVFTSQRSDIQRGRCWAMYGLVRQCHYGSSRATRGFLSSLERCSACSSRAHFFSAI